MLTRKSRQLATAILLALGATGLASCGNLVYVDIEGAAGVSHDGEGNLTVHVMACKNSTQEILVESVKGGAAEVRGRFEAPEKAEGYIEVSLSSPESWVETTPLLIPLDPNENLQFDAKTTKPGGPNPVFAYKLYSPVMVTVGELFDYRPGEIVVSYESYSARNRAVSLEEFKSYCDD